MKEVALQQGVYASFMPKPFTEQPGSGMHTHMSLFEGDRNVFLEPGAEFELSKMGRAFIAGLLRACRRDHRRPNQWVNSYKRLWGGGEAADRYICWGHNNRSALVRVPMYKPQKGNATRIEIRSLGLGLQPLPGVRGDPGRRAEGDRGRATSCRPAPRTTCGRSPRAERRALGIEPLPQSLDEAISVMESSELVAETLGEHVFDFFLRNKREEWDEYRRQVTAFELDRYLPML